MKTIKLVEERFQEYVNSGKLTGIAYAVNYGAEECAYGTIGYADLARTKPMQTNTVFRLASMTKPITACAVLIAEERGLLSIDAPIGKYIEGFAHGGVGVMENGAACFSHSAREITIKDCLTHSSGLGSGVVGDFQFNRIPKPYDLRKNVYAWNGAFLDFEPGSRQAYSWGVAMELLAYIVERTSGMPYAEFLKKNIFEPLGMSDTSYELSGNMSERLAEMYRTGEDGRLQSVDLGVSGFEAFECGYPGGSAGLFSTLEDYSKFARMLANNGSLYGKRILTKNSVRKMRTPMLPKTLDGINEYFNWGLGVRVCEKRGEKQPLSDGSFGWSGAYGTHFWVEPETGVSAVLMLNKADVGGSGSPYSAEFERLVEKSLS